jgi:hypothetical protein
LTGVGEPVLDELAGAVDRLTGLERGIQRLDLGDAVVYRLG